MYNSSNVAERIKELSKKRNISVKQMLLDVGLGFNTMSNMKTSMPKADNLAKIADYLDCSVDYLLGRTDIPEVNTLDNMVRIYTAARAKDGEHLDDNIQYVREILIEKLRNAPASSDEL